MTDVEQSSNPRDLQTDVFIINEETIPQLIERTGLTEAYFQSLIYWDQNIGAKAYFFPKLVSPEGFKEIRTETDYVIQYRHPDDPEELNDGWEDETVIPHTFVRQGPEAIARFFERWGRGEYGQWRLVKRVTERRIAETIVTEKVE